MLKKIPLIVIALLFSTSAWAWGKRGHDMVGSLAAQVLGHNNPPAHFLVIHSYDMGFYNNVPDLVWKADPETYKKEFTQHYTDLEIFDRAFAEKKDKVGWIPERAKFFKKYNTIEPRAGRSVWRIQEFDKKLADIAKRLRKQNKDVKAHQAVQLEWLTTAGIMGHYVADLAQPMHVSENHDGQLTDQKGLHHWFEESIIDDLYPALSAEVFQRAKSRWPEFYKKHKKTKAFELALELAKNSHHALPEVLGIDKKAGRASAAAVSAQYKEIATERLTQGVLYLAVIWSQHLGWKYDGTKFYSFTVAPAYIEPDPEK